MALSFILYEIKILFFVFYYTNEDLCNNLKNLFKKMKLKAILLIALVLIEGTYSRCAIEQASLDF